MQDFIPPLDPYTLFSDWFALAQKMESSYPNAMMLATLDTKGMPASRAVLMKDYNEDGIVFYTNRKSRKGEGLLAYPKASICFYWKSLQRQVRAEGMVSLVSDSESDAYFATRPRGSQIGAWASLQSEVLPSRDVLISRVSDLEEKYKGKDIPRPSHWGGYRLVPQYFEFWQERDFRLHDRITYERVASDDAWKLQRLFP